MVDLYVSDPLESMYREMKAMVKYCYSKGSNVPSELIQQYGEIEKEVYEYKKFKGEESNPIKLNEYENIVPLAVKIGLVHNALADLLEPAVPQSICMIEEQMGRDSIWTQFGCLPIVRRFMIVSIVSIVSFIAVSLSERTTARTISEGIFTSAPSLDLLYVFIFLLSASALGASFSTMLKLSKYIGSRTFDPKYETSYYVRLLVGLMSGLIITELVPKDVFGELVEIGKPTLALLGGFSSDLVYKILQRLVDIVESALVPGNKPVQVPKAKPTCTLMQNVLSEMVPQKTIQPAVSEKTEEKKDPVPNNMKSQDKKQTEVIVEKPVTEIEKKELEMKVETDKEVDFTTLNGFRGDLAWIHKQEGHSGKPYWPGGDSGITLDPGVDLGYIEPEIFESSYKTVLNGDSIQQLKACMGVKGGQARDLLNKSPNLTSITISRDQAENIFPVVVKPYWEKICKRFPELLKNDTLSSVQTAFLSLAYNRGPENKNIEILKEPVQKKNWREVAEIIGNMQQDHKVEGVRKRRRNEAELIHKELV